MRFQIQYLDNPVVDRPKYVKDRSFSTLESAYHAAIRLAQINGLIVAIRIVLHHGTYSTEWVAIR